MRKVLTACIVLLPALFLLSCLTNRAITMDDLQGIHRGMTPAQFMSQITAPPRLAFPVEYQGIQYAMQIFPMQTGTQTVSQYVSMYPHGGYVTTRQVPVYTDYAFVFNDKGLMVWGFFNELQKSDEDIIQNLAPLIASEVKKEDEELARKQMDQQQQSKPTR
jgi:hypothetical protein